MVCSMKNLIGRYNKRVAVTNTRVMISIGVFTVQGAFTFPLPLLIYFLRTIVRPSMRRF